MVDILLPTDKVRDIYLAVVPKVLILIDNGNGVKVLGKTKSLKSLK